jgi:hypothetical protein
MSANLTADPMARLTNAWAKACIVAGRADTEAQNNAAIGAANTDGGEAPTETPRLKETQHGAS